MDPEYVPDERPEMLVPVVPTSPVMSLVPELEIEEAARRPKL